MDIQSLPTRFRLPLPKPTNGSFSSFKYNESPINNSAPTNLQPSQASSLDVIPCQQTLNLHPIGKPMPNRRGRKPLATMPSGKKHVQNLTNQRAFRQRKENYIRNLEVKASNLEMLYNSAQDEIKSLNNRIAMLEKRLASSRSNSVKNTNNGDPNSHYGGIVNSVIYQAIIDNRTDEDILMSDVSSIEFNDNTDTSSTGSSNAIYIRSNDYSPNDMSLPTTSQQMPKDPDIFCDTSAERIWIASTSTASPLYSTFITGNSSQNTQPYFPQASTAITTTAHHPLNLKWILSDAPTEE